jgi:hypothetical protein
MPNLRKETSMTNPNLEPVAQDAVILHPPEDGIDVITFLVDDNTIGLALSIRDDTLGEFVIPIGGIQAARLHATLGRLLHLTDEQADQILNRLRDQR